LVQGHPAVDAAGNGDGADVVPERHDAVPIGAHGGGIGGAARPPAGVEALDSTLVMHQREQVAAHSAQVRAGDGDGRVGGDGGVDGVATSREHVHPGLRGEAIGARHHVPRRARGVERGVRR
jgi:hypothetical protein